jgi:nuclear pore complex protein Nup62
MLTTELHSRLNDLSSSLTQMIDAVNGLSLSSTQDVSNGGDQRSNDADRSDIE